MKKYIFLVTVAWLVMLAYPVFAAGTYETPPVLSALDFVPKDVPLKGDRYRIDNEVPTDGYLAAYTIRSDFGRIEARGPGVLQMRVKEVQALARLKEMEKLDVFMESIKNSASTLGGAVVNVVTNPVEVAKSIPAGVGRFLERTSRQAKTAFQKLDDVSQNKEAGAPKGSESGSSTQNVAVAAGVAVGRTTRDILGYDEKRRDLSRQLGVDPYTTNPLLKKELDAVAWAAFAGGLGVDALASKVPGSKFIQSSSLVSDWVYTKPPGDLKVWIEKSLKDMGVKQENIDLFLRQKYWTLTTQTALVMALQKLDGVEGRVQVLDTAVTAENEDQVRFLAVGMTMLASQHKTTALKAILDGKPVGRTIKGRVIATMPLDYVCWTERVAAFVQREDFLSNQPMVIITGSFSPLALNMIKKAGWEVRTGSSL